MESKSFLCLPIHGHGFFLGDFSSTGSFAIFNQGNEDESDEHVSESVIFRSDSIQCSGNIEKPERKKN